MYTKISVPENKRIILTKNERFARLLTPGVYRIFCAPFQRIGMELHELTFPVFRSKWTRFLIEKRPDLVSQHFVVAETGPLDIAMVLVNGRLYDVLLPERTVLFWKAAGEIRVEVVNIGAEDDVPANMPPELESNLTAPNSGEHLEEDWIYQMQEES
jgi:hypothetical protein